MPTWLYVLAAVGLAGLVGLMVLSWIVVGYAISSIVKMWEGS